MDCSAIMFCRYGVLSVVLSVFLARSSLGQVNVAPLQPTQNTAPGIYLGPQNPNPSVSTSWSIVKSNPITGIHVGHVPGTDLYLFLGRNSFKKLASAALDVMAGVYNLTANSFKNITVDTNIFCNGLTASHDGRVMVVGGHSTSASGMPDGRKGIRAYKYSSPSGSSLNTITKMRWNRWYPTATLMPDNTILIAGGTINSSENGITSNYTERWNPRTPTLFPGPMYPVDPTYAVVAGPNFYPSNFVLPTGDVFNLIDSISRFIKPWQNQYRKNPDGSSLSAPLYPREWKTQFPRSGTAAMMALTHENGYGSVDIVMFGGTPASNLCLAEKPSAQDTPANPNSFRLKISWTCKTSLVTDKCNVTCANDDWSYTFSSGWQKELMGIPRVGGDAVLLPNGDTVLVGGAQTGCVGGIINGVNRGNNPAFWALLYQPDKPSGSRYTVLSASTIARLYHGSAVLTTDGNVMAQGCDACDAKGIFTGASFWSKSPTQRWDYRVEVFTTPYFNDVLNKPRIASVNNLLGGIVPVAYGQTFNITWVPFTAGQTGVKITKVSLVAPSMVTHGFDTNQRVVFLEITRQDPGVVTVKVPCNIAVLPPQLYMVFVMNGKTYSRARWVQLTLP